MAGLTAGAFVLGPAVTWSQGSPRAGLDLSGLVLSLEREGWTVDRAGHFAEGTKGEWLRRGSEHLVWTISQKASIDDAAELFRRIVMSPSVAVPEEPLWIGDDAVLMNCEGGRHCSAVVRWDRTVLSVRAPSKDLALRVVHEVLDAVKHAGLAGESAGEAAARAGAVEKELMRQGWNVDQRSGGTVEERHLVFRRAGERLRFFVRRIDNAEAAASELASLLAARRHALRGAIRTLGDQAFWLSGGKHGTAHLLFRSGRRVVEMEGPTEEETHYVGRAIEVTVVPYPGERGFGPPWRRVLPSWDPISSWIWYWPGERAGGGKAPPGSSVGPQARSPAPAVALSAKLASAGRSELGSVVSGLESRGWMLEDYLCLRRLEVERCGLRRGRETLSLSAELAGSVEDADRKFQWVAAARADDPGAQVAVQADQALLYREVPSPAASVLLRTGRLVWTVSAASRREAFRVARLVAKGAAQESSGRPGPSKAMTLAEARAPAAGWQL